MHRYLDTADRPAAEPLLATGLFAGLTTNPTILQRASRGVADIEHSYAWARAAGAKEIYFQTWGEDTATLVDAGRDGIGDVLAMHELLEATGSTTKGLLASIRDVASMVTLARSGVQHFTFSPVVAQEFFTEELTIAASQAFEEAVVATTR
jgi:transaldolase